MWEDLRPDIRKYEEEEKTEFKCPLLGIRCLYCPMALIGCPVAASDLRKLRGEGKGILGIVLEGLIGEKGILRGVLERLEGALSLIRPLIEALMRILTPLIEPLIKRSLATFRGSVSPTA